MLVTGCSAGGLTAAADCSPTGLQEVSSKLADRARDVDAREDALRMMPPGMSYEQSPISAHPLHSWDPYPSGPS